MTTSRTPESASSCSTSSDGDRMSISIVPVAEIEFTEVPPSTIPTLTARNPQSARRPTTAGAVPDFGAAVALSNDGDPRAALAGLAVPHGLVAWHGDGMEAGRHPVGPALRAGRRRGGGAAAGPPRAGPYRRRADPGDGGHRPLRARRSAGRARPTVGRRLRRDDRHPARPGVHRADPRRPSRRHRGGQQDGPDHPARARCRHRRQRRRRPAVLPLAPRLGDRVDAQRARHLSRAPPRRAAPGRSRAAGSRSCPHRSR